MILALLLAAGTVTPLFPGSGVDHTNTATTGFTATCATTGNDTAVTMPVDIANNDTLFLWAVSNEVGTNAHSITVAAGWTNATYSGGGTINTFSGTTHFSLWWKLTNGTEVAPTVTRATTTTAICATIVVWRGGVTTGNPWEAISTAASTSTTTPLVTSAITSLTNDGATIHFFGAGITANVVPTFPAATGAATRGMGAADAARIGQGGLTTNRAVIGAAWDVMPTAGSTGTASVSFVNGTTGTRVGILLQMKPQPGANPLIWNPIQLPPNGKDVAGIDTSTQQLVVEDQSPNGNKDLLWVRRTGSGVSDAWYLAVSTDSGGTWTHLTATSGAAPSLTLSVVYQSVCQDTVNYKLHIVTWTASGGTPVYHRMALTYTANHVTGFTWDAADVAGPSFDVTGDTTDVAGHVNLREVIDGSNNHILVLAALDQPTINNILVRLVVSRTTSLAPTTGTDWKKLTDHTTAGFDVVMRKFCSAGADAGSLPHDVFSRPAVPTGTTCTLNQSPSEEQHDSDVAFAQLQTSKDLAFFLGEMFYNDTATGSLLSHIEMFRFTPSGTDWALDAGNNGTLIAVSLSSTAAQPCIGNAVGTKFYIWFTWYNGDGAHIGRLNSSGTWTKDPIVQADTSTGNNLNQVWGDIAINVRADEQSLYLTWARYDLSPTASHYFVASYDSSWHITDISVQMGTPNNAFSYQMAMRSSCYGMSNGICSIGYAFRDWDNANPHRWVSMVFAGTLPPLGPQVDTTACAGTSVAHCPQITGLTATTITTATFVTVNATELLIALVAQQGVGSVSTAISDNGISKSVGWTKIGVCAQSTTTDAEVWGAVTSAPISGKTVSAVFTATSVASSNLTVVPYSSSMTTLPTNFVCAHNSSGAAVATVVNVGTNSQILESGADSAGTGVRTATSNATIDPVGQAGATGFVWDEFTGALSGTNNAGTTAPTSPNWALAVVEVLPSGGVGTASLVNGMMMGLGL